MTFYPINWSRIKSLAFSLVACIAVTQVNVAQAQSATQAPEATGDIPKARIAVIGGTFLNDVIFSTDLIKKEFTVETKLGTSPTIYYAEYEGLPFYYVHDHGSGKFQQTWAALYDLGVEEAIGGATAGAINKKMGVYDYIVVDDFMDFNIDRPLSFPKEIYRDPNLIPLPRFTPAMDTDIRNILIAEAKKAFTADPFFKKKKVHDSGVVVQTRGGRFETVAEIKAIGQWGGDLVTMSIGTEIVYARQLGINYASLVVVSNPAEGVADWDFSLMEELYPRINPLSLNIVLASLKPVAALQGKARVADGLINHPEMTSKKK
jgi:5'-methylthioadenosine phosphorylase